MHTSPSTMKKEQASRAAAIASKASASKKQSVLPMTPKVISPAQPKPASMLSSTESIIPVTTGENNIISDKPLVNAGTENLVPSGHQSDCQMSEPFNVSVTEPSLPQTSKTLVLNSEPTNAPSNPLTISYFPAPFSLSQQLNVASPTPVVPQIIQTPVQIASDTPVPSRETYDAPANAHNT